MDINWSKLRRNADPVCTGSGNMTHRGAVSESFYLEAPYFNMGIAYQTKAKRLSEMTVTTSRNEMDINWSKLRRNAGPVCTGSGNMTHRGAVSESFYLEAPYFNMGIAYQTKAKRLSEMTVTTKKP